MRFSVGKFIIENRGYTVDFFSYPGPSGILGSDRKASCPTKGWDCLIYDETFACEDDRKAEYRLSRC